ncbi:probable cytokinin riboside 5'-monophosphate phosphoribohydrolase LOGL2 [Panicum virgatum]|uniref:Cytokinin riboside 5'-monophosphate phosphoribohydrolase n=1 Tax=Panicum virgatum TaxID=38727 RepID=A0A8T0XKI0_PANVG|nr:probable cytokinin riboside 5'-monophosphate phosphoribohydrolase LOGL2 [Panicum virgatum]KAG2659967.1 hypothetical protein PVAP13_1KG387300 [Panicum virgatum]
MLSLPPQVTPSDFDKQPEKVKREAMEIKMDEKAPAVAVVLSRFRRICVFCGSSHGKKCYQDAAIELGKELVARNIDLVYGGGSVGLMGLVSQAVHNGGRHVIGVIPKTLMPREVPIFFLLSISSF